MLVLPTTIVSTLVGVEMRCPSGPIIPFESRVVCQCNLPSGSTAACSFGEYVIDSKPSITSPMDRRPVCEDLESRYVSVSSARESNIESVFGVDVFCLNMRSRGGSPADELTSSRVLDSELGPKPMIPCCSEKSEETFVASTKQGY